MLQNLKSCLAGLESLRIVAKTDARVSALKASLRKKIAEIEAANPSDMDPSSEINSAPGGHTLVQSTDTNNLGAELERMKEQRAEMRRLSSDVQKRTERLIQLIAECEATCRRKPMP